MDAWIFKQMGKHLRILIEIVKPEQLVLWDNWEEKKYQRQIVFFEQLTFNTLI